MTSPASKAAFGHRSTALEVIAGHDLSGRAAIVTGGASGIGVETVRALATAGARVTIATRDLAKANAMAETLRGETGSDAVEAALLDLGSLASVLAFVEGYLAGHSQLHLLINNAGIMATPFGHTADGFELQFGTNHVGHFALTTGLLPALRAAGRGASKARVVSLSSIGHRRSDIHYDDLNFERRPYDPFAAYGQSKTANALFAVGLTQRYAAEGITSNAVMPGGILTGLQKHMPREQQIAAGWFDEQGNINPRFKSTEQGAATSIWAAVSPELEGVGGLYLEDCAVAVPWIEGRPFSGYMGYALDPDNAERLWSVSEQLIAR
ncbi:MAG: SDR family NAD(P)-dependent oxidoreductase [Chloroflexi bacterium]|nr:SDR family NAD(P)-dependent oxidoreductase [Chloroflexota bacterium]